MLVALALMVIKAFNAGKYRRQRYDSEMCLISMNSGPFQQLCAWNNIP